MLPIGSTLQGRFVIEKVLGYGGMGVVYLARQSALADKRVAIKELLFKAPDPDSRAQATRQFRGEAHLLATLDHPNLVDVTDFFETPENCYLVMNYVEGRTLQDLIDDAPTFLETAQVLSWLDEICDVLQYLHERLPPVIYRDLKPSNIMIDGRSHVKLLDFGIARAAGDQSQTATFIKGAGTPGYAPVEQFGQGGTTDPRTDIYSLGATVYTMLTRNIPPTAVDLMLGEVSLPPPRRINPGVPPRLEALVLRMMGLRKEDRHQTIHEVRDELATISSDQDFRAPLTRAADPVMRAREATPLKVKRRENPETRGRAPETGEPRAGEAPASPALRSAPATARPVSQVLLPDEDRLPGWARNHLLANQQEEEESEPDHSALVDRYHQRWTFKGLLLVMLVGLSFPLMLNPRSLGPLAVVNSGFHSLGSLVQSLTGNPTAALLASTLLQALVPLVLWMAFRWRGSAFGQFLAAFWLCEVLLEAGLCLGFPRDAGTGRQWSQALAWLGVQAKTLPSLARPLQGVGMGGMALCLLGMGRLLYETRPGSAVAPLPVPTGRPDSR